METTKNFIDGVEVDAADVYDNIDPATGGTLGAVSRSGEAEVDRAVTVAKATHACKRTAQAVGGSPTRTWRRPR